MIADDSERGFYVLQIGEVHYRDKRPWVARVVGVSPRFGFRRQFVRPRRDYSNTEKRMSGRIAGVIDCFLLESGWVCEVFEPGRGGRKHPDLRYFARVKDDGLVPLTEEDVIKWVKTSKR